MATPPSLPSSRPYPQRSYRAPCPGCGAPVEFRSAQSVYAVCAYCHSTVLRSGDTLSRIGKMAELFDDFSPLQLMASGVWQVDGKALAFTVVGRLQYKYAEGNWTEWHAVFGDGSSGYLSEDNGAFAFALPLAAPAQMPDAAQYPVGGQVSFGGRAFSVASNQQVVLQAAVGELPHLPPTGQPFAMVELRSQAGAGSAADDTVLSIDYGTLPPTVSVGRSVQLEDLQLTGLRDESAKDESGRQFACPNCGAPVDVKLASSKSITCAACHSLIDLTQGLGAELRHAVQDEPIEPLIPLGSIGQFQGVPWQVVGFTHRMGNNPAEPDGHFGWQEYLLYQRQRGFIFLVDGNDGWSVVKPTTGAPQMGPGGRSASYLGKVYTFKDSYTAATRYVVGEFYWQVSRGQQTVNRDFADGRHLLNMEQSAAEVTWSVGSQIDSNAVAAAFKLDASKALFQRGDATPLSFGAGSLKVGLIVLLVIVILLMLLFSRTSCDPALQDCASSGSGYRSSGGAYGGGYGGGFGGSSGGGGHK